MKDQENPSFGVRARFLKIKHKVSERLIFNLL